MIEVACAVGTLLRFNASGRLPWLPQVMFVLFAVVGAMWGLVLVRQRTHAHRLHFLMVALVAFKALTLLSQAGMYQLIRSTGHPEGWNVAFYVFNFLRGILFFTVSHRSLVRSHRQERGHTEQAQVMKASP